MIEDQKKTEEKINNLSYALRKNLMRRKAAKVNKQEKFNNVEK